MIQLTDVQARAALLAYQNYKPTASNCLHQTRLAHIPVILNDEEFAVCLAFSQHILQNRLLASTVGHMEDRLQIACSLFIMQAWADTLDAQVLNPTDDRGVLEYMMSITVEWSSLAVRNVVGRDHPTRGMNWLRQKKWDLDLWMPLFLNIRKVWDTYGQNWARREGHTNA